MRILDKNTDFYDFYQGVYRDSSVTFDRTDSFVVTKEIICDRIYTPVRYYKLQKDHKFLLLQVCNTFWLFLASITERNEYDRPLDYLITPITTWKNYDRPRALIKLDVVEFDWSIERMFRDYAMDCDDEKVLKTLKQHVDTNDYKVVRGINNHTVYYGDGRSEEKHIPLLKASGLAAYINPLDMYLSLEEYFSLEKTSSERIYSRGITDVEKAESHGFDKKLSFRGK